MASKVCRLAAFDSANRDRLCENQLSVDSSSVLGSSTSHDVVHQKERGRFSTFELYFDDKDKELKKKGMDI